MLDFRHCRIFCGENHYWKTKTQPHKREKTMNMQNRVLYMGGILDSWGEFSGSPELPAITTGTALPALLGSTLVVLEVTVECETEAPNNPETNCWESVDAIGMTEDGLEAGPFDVKEGFKLAALAAVDVAIDEPTALGVSLVSDCIPWFAAFCACSRANWKKIFQFEMRKIKKWKWRKLKRNTNISMQSLLTNLKFLWYWPRWLLSNLIVIIPERSQSQNINHYILMTKKEA